MLACVRPSRYTQAVANCAPVHTVARQCEGGLHATIGSRLGDGVTLDEFTFRYYQPLWVFYSLYGCEAAAAGLGIIPEYVIRRTHPWLEETGPGDRGWSCEGCCIWPGGKDERLPHSFAWMDPNFAHPSGGEAEAIVDQEVK